MSERPSKHDGHCLVLMQAVQAPTELSFVGCTCALAWRQKLWDAEERIRELTVCQYCRRELLAPECSVCDNDD